MSSSAASAAAGASGVLSAPLFRALSTAVSQNQIVEFGGYAQFATQSVEGPPSVRTINMRGAPFEDARDEQTRGALKFSSDARALKIAELLALARAGKKPQAELC